MTPEERTMITALFDRLKAAEGTPKDADADALIRERLGIQPGAGYLMTQTILVQEHGLELAQQRIAELEKELAAAKSAPSAQPTSFLGGLGPWGKRAAGPETAGSQSAGGQSAGGQSTGPSPWRRNPEPPAYQQPAYQQPGMPQQPYQPQAAAGPSFMRTAMTTAAGVAGGALLFHGMQSLFAGGASPFGAHQTSDHQSADRSGWLGGQDSAASSHSAGADQPVDHAVDSAAFDNAAYDDGGSFDSGDDMA